ncbi:MAG: glycosyltransferase [Bacteroidales bacterium]|jgi:hypothetical protein|nr:glycosyltransferase [Bacteroidales bacterium]
MKVTFDNLEMPSDKRSVDVTVILNIWKRRHLKEQLLALLTQTVLPAEIWVIHYEHNVEVQSIIEQARTFFPNIVLIHSDKNLRYFGRFSIAINVTTKFAWLLDDDIIPTSGWLERCVARCTALNAVITCTGRIIPPDNYRPEDTELNDSKGIFFGDFLNPFYNTCPDEVVVDYACNSYFFMSEWLKGYWSIWPQTFDSGEDIHLSATAKIRFGAATVVLAQPTREESGNTNKLYGSDLIATWRTGNFLALRENIFKYLIEEHHWKTLRR